ncbi:MULTISPECIES: hypothetical protein [Streptomyces]|uniref:Uncharacterized protein n=1 Tax=Streptomyces fimbriatus TaxID=68197 RepID=A0ABW0CZ05_STRFI
MTTRTEARSGPGGALPRPGRTGIRAGSTPPWPAVRTHAFATRPAGPRTPDGHLAAGGAATALDGYAESPAREPGDPHLLAGWTVARAAPEPVHAARRFPARPERLRPQGAG